MYEIHTLEDGTVVKEVPDYDGDCKGCVGSGARGCKELPCDGYNKFKRHYRTAPATINVIEVD